MSKISRKIRYGLIATAILVLGVAIAFVNNAYWQPIGRFLGPAQIATIVDQNTTLYSRDLPKILGHQERFGQNSLLLVNYNDTRLCGSLGCLYSVYILGDQQPIKKVLNIVLVPNTDKKAPVLSAIALQDEELPCLRSIQPATNGGQEEFTYCMRQGEYQLHEQRLLAGR
jgi:hypothetical protein